MKVGQCASAKSVCVCHVPACLLRTVAAVWRQQLACWQCGGSSRSSMALMHHTAPQRQCPALPCLTFPTICPAWACPACLSCLQTCSDHTDQVWDVRFRPDGARLASVSDDRSVCLFDFAA